LEEYKMNIRISTNFPMQGMDEILKMKKQAQMAGPIGMTAINPNIKPNPANTMQPPGPNRTSVSPPSPQSAPSPMGNATTQATTFEDPNMPIPSSDASSPAGVSLGSMNTGLGPGGALTAGHVPNPTQDAPDAKLFFKDNKISENGMHGPFIVNGKKLNYPVKFNRNTQQFEYLDLARAIEAP
jgi:hypothetical protein